MLRHNQISYTWWPLGLLGSWMSNQCLQTTDVNNSLQRWATFIRSNLTQYIHWRCWDNTYIDSAVARRPAILRGPHHQVVLLWVSLVVQFPQQVNDSCVRVDGKLIGAATWLCHQLICDWVALMGVCLYLCNPEMYFSLLFTGICQIELLTMINTGYSVLLAISHHTVMEKQTWKNTL